MARSNAVWGIDIGNSSLKALRCRPADGPDQIAADAFDYIEYPKILSQPGADPAALMAEALKQFTSRNTVRGDRVAVSVSGQNGLARFIKLPPVESKKIPAIVAYEARQQIPFALDDVVWDYQRMVGGSEEEGFALEAEVGLFAMKRDQVFRALEPLRKAGIAVDFVQLTPLALYNFVAFDQLSDLPPPEEFEPDNPPPSVVILSMGTDATDLVITNGFRVWQRSIPLGGNHFTRALTKELKLTFAKAEHLKRNATAAKDPKAVFQAMRPVFNDLLTEIQRSIGYFTSIDRAATIDRVIALGNATKLPGLRRYLAQSLGYDVVRLESYRKLVGGEVVDSPAFKENQLCFGVSYGLAIQGLGKGFLRTNLLPKEIVKDRMVREKKPWAVAAVAILLMALTISFVSFSRALGTVDESIFGDSEQKLEQVAAKANEFKSKLAEVEAEYESINQIGLNLVSNVEGRLRWLELLHAINVCLPKDPEGKRPEEIELRNEVHITNFECQRIDRLEDWFAAMQEREWYLAPEEQTAQAADEPGEAAEGGTTQVQGPTGAGYIVQLTGYHYHNRDVPGMVQGAQFVRETLMHDLQTATVMLPSADKPGEMEPVSMKELGIGYPALIDPGRPVKVTLTNPNVARVRGSAIGADDYEDSEDGFDEDDEEGGGGFVRRTVRTRPTLESEQEEIAAAELLRFDFRVQFVWQPTLPSERKAKKAEALAAAAAAGDEAATDGAEAGSANAANVEVQPETNNQP